MIQYAPPDVARVQQACGAWHNPIGPRLSNALNTFHGNLTAADCQDLINIVNQVGHDIDSYRVAQWLVGTPTASQILTLLQNMGSQAAKQLAAWLKYLAGNRGNVPGSPSPGVRFNGRQLIGRPPFAQWTQQTVEISPSQARRHIIAWHCISGFVSNSSLSDADAANLLTHAGNVPPAVLLEAQQKAAQVEQRTPGTGNLYQLAFLMNSNPNNLWPGGSHENSTINSMRAAIDSLGQAGSTDELIEKAEEFQQRSDAQQPGAVKEAYALASTMIARRIELCEQRNGGHQPTPEMVLSDDFDFEMVATIETMLEFDVHSEAAFVQATAQGLEQVFQVFYAVSNGQAVDPNDQAAAAIRMLQYP